MSARNVVLNDDQSQLLERFVSNGRYQNTHEALDEGLRLLELHEAEDEAKLNALRAATDIAIADIANGRMKSFDNVEELDLYLTQVIDEELGVE